MIDADLWIRFSHRSKSESKGRRVTSRKEAEIEATAELGKLFPGRDVDFSRVTVHLIGIPGVKPGMRSDSGRRVIRSARGLS